MNESRRTFFSGYMIEMIGNVGTNKWDIYALNIEYAFFFSHLGWLFPFFFSLDD